MSEVEQLRKEVNELRERLAALECKNKKSNDDRLAEFQKINPAPFPPTPWFPLPAPTWTSETARHYPPGTILC